MNAASPPGSPPKNKKSWSELQLAVRKSHRVASTVSNVTPHSFTFHHSGNECRLYFLGVPIRQRENTLFYVELTADDSTSSLEWKQLLHLFDSSSSSQQLSKEEQLMHERKRLRSLGITAYDHCPASNKFAFSSCSNLFVCEDRNAQGGFKRNTLMPIEVKSDSSSGIRLDPQLCPSNPELLAFVCGGDLWVTHISSGHEHRSTDIKDDPLSAGTPSYIVQEEFDRYTGFWWQPVSTDGEESDVYRILYEEVDESDVDILNIVSTSGNGVDQYRYPKAGSENSKSCLKIMEFQICNVQSLHLPSDFRDVCTNPEYLVRAGWTNKRDEVYAQVLDRKQQTLHLILLPLGCFVRTEKNSPSLGWADESGLPHICRPTVLYVEKNDIWINVHDILHFLPQETAGQRSFIWASESSGFNHLYLITVHTGARDVGTKISGVDDVQVVERTAITSGNWIVEGKKIWVDEQKKLVYFVGCKKTPLETHLYVASYLNKTGVVKQLTEPLFSHSVEMDKKCTHFVTAFSNVMTVPSSKVFRIVHTEIPVGYTPPQLFSFTNKDGIELYGMVFRPHKDGVDLPLNDGSTYPTVLFVYGGPHVQLVTNSFKGLRFLRLHTLASQGYAVVVVDARGSFRRGLNFEAHLRHQMGMVELEDQVEALRWLAERDGYLDLNRVAIHGWSYGGFLSLMGLVQRPDVFKVGIAAAPVTDWKLYDTGYTERYMGLPTTNPLGYDASSLLKLADHFPAEDNRLLIVHGLIDENVHFHHTSALVSELIKQGKPHDLQIYPNERHGIRNAQSNEHYETLLLSYLQNHL
ncbi:hypothetical protein CAPTEDRAFT_5954 [Capitella teleta]|uniref:Dipeptidyl peptidase 9 n=1 Tax=Capitella teleta TaxID=283909 RepID=R7TGL3_CAPTE|nr:hypothetical protein CAPTEDRAFT_5954 [Capitella teleta]|eukprot:ELT92637.1 hypothetical protein CAPTEDRAFT_5954 [Capitella teleta]